MPVLLPGFSSFSSFFNLFLPLKNEQQGNIFYPPPITFDGAWFSSSETPESLVPLTEDCLRCIKKMIYQYADLKQREYILRVLFQYIPQFPVELINVAQTLYCTLRHKKEIDLAVLNALGLASCHFLTEGNAISQLAQFVRETIIACVGETFLSRFLTDDENSSQGAMFTALAVMAIVLKYWTDDPAAPQRRFFQIPPFLANLVLRIGIYWDHLGRMAQHATEHCLLPAINSGTNYLCVRDEVNFSRPAGLRLLERNAWTCAQATASEVNQWKPVERCNFELSAATLKQVQEEGVVWSRHSPQQPEEMAVSSGRAGRGNAAALMLPVVATLGLRGAGQAALGTSLAAFMGYAWYSMFSRQPGHGVTQNEADQSGILTDDERKLLERLSSRHSQIMAVSDDQLPVESPFNADEIIELKHLLNALATEGPAAPARRRKKRAVASTSTESTAVSRKEYWSHREQQVAKDSPEKPLLKLLKNGPQPACNYSLAVARESFPLTDAWYTRMDQLDLTRYSTPFQDRLLAISTAIANNQSITPPIAGLPVAGWLHLGRYYELFYKKILHSWTKIVLSMNTALSAEYDDAARQVEKIVKKLNNDWNNTALDPHILRNLTLQSNTLHQRHARLQIFSAREKERIADGLKNKTWTFSRDIPVNEFIWEKYRLSYLDNIDLSQFTTEYSEIIKGFIVSNVAWFTSDAGMIDLVDLYTGMSVLAISRARDGMEDDDIKKAYNYSVLDEQLSRIIRENISRLWKKKDQDEYLLDYNQIAYEMLPLWWKTKQRLPVKPAQEANVALQNKTSVAQDVIKITEEKLFSQVNWETVRNASEAAEALPTERFSARKHVEETLKTALDDTVNKMIELANANILNVDQFIESWIAETLRAHNQQQKYTSASQFNVDFPRHADEEIKSFDGFGGRNNPPRVYTLYQIVRGEHREYDRKYNTKSRISWPDNFSADLRSRFETGISGDIDQRIATYFDGNKQSLRDLYRIMIRRAALSYLGRKNAIETSDFYHHVFANAVAMYLKGKNDAQLVSWHNSPLSGLIFIPAEKAAQGEFNNIKAGVFLSIWNNDYYEVPWPGLAQTIRKEGRTGNYRPKITSENNKAFQKFIERYRTIRVGRNLAHIENLFDYQAEYHDHPLLIITFEKVETYTKFHAPFSFSTLCAENLIDRQIALQREDIQDLYDHTIFSDAELSRAIAHERINALSIVTGVLLMGAGFAFGGPAWAWVLASLASSLLLDVVPHAVLYTQADSDEEREIYMQAMVFAIAFEVGGNIASEAAAPLLNAAVYRFTRLSSTSFSTTLPQWYQFASTKLEHTLTKSGARRVRKIADDVAPLSEASKNELDQLIAKFDTPPQDPQSFAMNLLRPKLKLPSVRGVGPGSGLLQQMQRLQEVAGQMRLLKFKTKYRILTQWEDTQNNFIRNSYLLIGEREADRVVVKLISHGSDFSYIYIPEDEWLRTTVKNGEVKDFLLTYYDSSHPKKVAKKYPALSKETSTIKLADYPKKGVHIFVPESWQGKMANFNLKFDDMQELYDDLPPLEPDDNIEISMSTKIQRVIEDSQGLQDKLKTIPHLDTPRAVKSLDEERNNVMKRVPLLVNYGQDIERFYPVPNILSPKDIADQSVKKWLAKVDDYINNSKGFRKISDDFVQLKKAGGAGLLTDEQLTKIENAFFNSYHKIENVAALLKKAQQDPQLQEQILITLARFVNSTDPHILGEAYQRLATTMERMHGLVYYHVIEKKLSRVIPVQRLDESTELAFVVYQDPFARIIITLPAIAKQADIAGILMHEMSHLAVWSRDFRYLNNPETGYPNLLDHHEIFGQFSLEKQSPYVALGRTQYFVSDKIPEGIKPLTEYDRALAQARVNNLPMLGAYAKMNNADSLVVLINALAQSFEFSHKGLVVKNVINADDWKITPVSSASRSKRSVGKDEDILFHQFREDIMACLALQSLYFTKESILSDETLELSKDNVCKNLTPTVI